MTYRDRIGFMLAVIIILPLTNIAYFAAPVLIDVKIYAVGDPEEYIYCATGSMVPPARYVGTGSVPSGQESYC